MTMSLLAPQSHPLRSLALLFTAWKTLLLAIAVGASISPAYDTSTNLLFARLSNSSDTPLLARQLTRWDALYFIHAAQHGKVYEQEYAFSTSLSSLLGGLSSFLPGHDGASAALAGVVVAHASHLISVLALYGLTRLVFPAKRELAFVAAVLHVVSPAGVFLSSPYAESPFSALSFVGSYLFALGSASSCKVRRALLTLAAGGVFGLATWFRSNGLASGLLFAIATLQGFANLVKTPSPSSLLDVVSPILGGTLVATGNVVPQYLAWRRFCLSSDPRSWCDNTIPSIYTFVQEHYWNVGFLRYWTPNQIPLFLLASPMLSILILSASHFLRARLPIPDARLGVFVQATAAIQGVVAILALTSYHVQIINRLASGYFVWYWWIAGSLVESGNGEKSGLRKGTGRGLVIFVVMYAAIQGALYASFLPPA